MTDVRQGIKREGSADYNDGPATSYRRRETQRTQMSNKPFYENARRLKATIATIREKYMQDMSFSDEEFLQQRGTAMYLVDKLGFGIGEEDDEYGVNCCELYLKDITLMKARKIKIQAFTRLYKHGMLVEAKVSKVAFDNLTRFKNEAQGEDRPRLFPLINNRHMHKYLENGFTAMDFRVLNASIMLEKQLADFTHEGDSAQEKKRSFNRAKSAMVVLCHHPFQSWRQAHINKKREQISKEQNDEEKHILKLQLNILRNDNPGIMSYPDPRIIVAWCRKNNMVIRSTCPQISDSWAIKDVGDTFEF